MKSDEKNLNKGYEQIRQQCETIFDALDGGGLLPESAFSSKDPVEALEKSALFVETKRRVEIILTDEGPVIWLEAVIDEEDGSVAFVRYHAEWVNRSYSKVLPESDALWRLAEYHVRTLSWP